MTISHIASSLSPEFISDLPETVLQIGLLALVATGFARSWRTMSRESNEFDDLLVDNTEANPLD